VTTKFKMTHFRVIANGQDRCFTTLSEAKGAARRYSWAQILDQWGFVRWVMDGNRLKRV